MHLIDRGLRSARPGDAVLSGGGCRRSDTPREPFPVSIVNPLDGPASCCRSGRTDWAVRVALWTRFDHDGGRRPACSRGGPEDLEPPGLSPLAEPLHIVVAQPAAGHRRAGRPGRLAHRLVPLGSAGAKAAAVMTGQADRLPPSGGQYEWDSAAPVGVAASGRLSCVPHRRLAAAVQSADPMVPDLLMCHRNSPSPLWRSSPTRSRAEPRVCRYFTMTVTQRPPTRSPSSTRSRPSRSRSSGR